MGGKKEKTQQVRLRIPQSINDRLDKIVEANQGAIDKGDVLIPLINSLLRRKPDLLSLLDNARDFLATERQLSANYLKVVKAYNLMILQLELTGQEKTKCEEFLKESSAFLERLSKRRCELEDNDCGCQ